MNAARLYAASLTERPLSITDATTARNVDTALAAVEDVLSTLIDISRMDTGRLEPDIQPVALAELLEQLCVEFQPEAAVKGLTLKVVRTGLWVRTDRRLLRRVLQNLVSNGIKYTATGTVLIGVRRRGNFAEVQVADTGPGIPANKHELIFREFERLDQTANSARGLGLGLSIVERIGKLLDVSVRVSSVQGRGSLFSVSLPRTRPEVQKFPAVDSNVAPAWQSSLLVGAQVLCIDNEPDVLAGMQTLLGNWGCRVALASSASSAVAVVVGDGFIPDVILADYHLDQGTGLDAARAVETAAARSFPVVIITADHSPEVQRNLREAACVLLRKPVKAAALRALLTQHVLKRRAAAAE